MKDLKIRKNKNKLKQKKIQRKKKFNLKNKILLIQVQ